MMGGHGCAGGAGMGGLQWRLAFVFWIAVVPASAETAMEVQSWCRDIAHTRFVREHKVNVGQKFEDGFCWGAFAALQTVSAFASADQRVLWICAPAESTR